MTSENLEMSIHTANESQTDSPLALQFYISSELMICIHCIGLRSYLK